ncbi:HPr kinase/phosphorylase [Pseudophaeobacter arcticus]|uniref:HPr kinase/phosphorylase n=1 Tax=Pseudophaeobacter arcticus TaxID=385492 RepID=UPI0004034FD8|nr:HPr kinase/phosphatase C-terminal domain-containing protein [Pseudophaeobacter arcticus]
MAPRSPSLTLHASCVALGGRGVLIRGASGSGKSSLALQLMAYGADLVADDQVQIWQQDAGIYARSPGAGGLIEARFVGILTVAAVTETAICAIIDLDQVETERLPAMRHEELLGQQIQIFRRIEDSHFAAAVIQFLKSGALDPDAKP